RKSSGGYVGSNDRCIPLLAGVDARTKSEQTGRREARQGEASIEDRPQHSAELTTIEASPYRPRASRPARQLLLSCRATPPLRGGGISFPQNLSTGAKQGCDSWHVRTIALATLSLTVLIACQSRQPSIENTRQLTREDFNRRAAEKFLPLFWREDTNRDDRIQPNELAVLWGYGDSDWSHWITPQQQFTAQFDEAYRAMLEPGPPASNPAEERRHKLVLDELAQGRPTLVETDLSRETP